VYSSHNYNAAGFGPGPYPGIIRNETWNREKQEEVFGNHEGTVFTRKHRAPLWIGEFGSVYNGPPGEKEDRLRALDDQIGVFEGGGAHWTTWTYKDIGVMGWVTLDPESDYLQMVNPILEMKHQLYVDFWMGWLPSTPARDSVRSLARLTEKIIDDPEIDPAANERYMIQAVLSGYAGSLMQPAMAKVFKGLSEKELDRVLSSFAFDRCKPNEGLIEVVKKHMNSE
jgi:hypothetical protein